MGCATCVTSTGSPAGCKSNGSCASGACNKLNTFDWLADLPAYAPEPFNIVEVSFNNGLRKDFYRKRKGIVVETGDRVMVESAFGQDLGVVSLSGELVKLQMRKKRIKEKDRFFEIIRVANEHDLERYEEAKSREYEIMVKARVIARSLNLKMKIGAVEVQGDNKKTTFYYTADGRVDFRQLIKEFAREFRTKVEMKQIGARQEAGKIGGIGSCGRELCCSTWLTDFKTVNTTAARYQNLSINQSKLSGQCGRLKCCLNYELDQYIEALKEFPKKADRLETKEGTAYLQKTDIFRKIMIYKYQDKPLYVKVPVERVKEILEMNARKERPEDLLVEVESEGNILEQDNTVGHITLDMLEKKEKQKKAAKRKRNRNRKKRKPGENNNRHEKK